jgi:hypothetical protein
MCGVDIFTFRKQLLNILSLKKCAPSGVTPVGALLGVILRGGWEHFLYEYLTLQEHFQIAASVCGDCAVEFAG